VEQAEQLGGSVSPQQLHASTSHLSPLSTTPLLREEKRDSRAVCPVGRAADKAPLKASSSWQVIAAALTSGTVMSMPIYVGQRRSYVRYTERKIMDTCTLLGPVSISTSVSSVCGQSQFQLFPSLIFTQSRLSLVLSLSSQFCLIVVSVFSKSRLNAV